jgi:hypothetical protein
MSALDAPTQSAAALEITSLPFYDFADDENPST